MQWSKVKSKGAGDALSGHTTLAIGTSLFTFGGRTNAGFSSDVYRFDTQTHVIEKLDVKGPRPQPRSGHSAIQRISSPGSQTFEFVMFGGVGSTTVTTFNDTWIFDIRTRVDLK